MDKDDYYEWIPVFSYDIKQNLNTFEKDFHEYFSKLPFEKRVSKTGKKLFKAYQQMQNALILVSKAANSFVEVEDYLGELDELHN